MIHIVQTDDTTLTGKNFAHEFHPAHKNFKKSSISGIPPEGYMTSDEFRQRAVLKVDNFCKKNGIL